ncbi:MAG: hypothetical protein DRI86_12090 [Bacteroidetes bacterium]|nr:MAG: hypothetical protein DRI86_12090 [Bacteroidota bacterium]
MPNIVNDGSNPSNPTQKQYPSIVNKAPAVVLDILEDKEVYVQFRDRLKTALSKFPSSRKTKIVHELISKNIVSLGLMHKTGTDMPPVVMFNKDKTLHRIFLEPDQINDSTGGSKDLLTLLNELMKVNKQISKEKRFVTEFQIYKIEEFQKDKKKIVEDILESIDWLKSIDLVYFGYLQLLALLAVDKNQPEKVKVFKVPEELVQKQIIKIISKSGNQIDKDPEKKRVYNLGIQFFILTYFLQISNKAAIDILKNHRGEWVNATLEDFAPAEQDLDIDTKFEKEAHKENLINKRGTLDDHHKYMIQEFQKIKINSFGSLAEIFQKLGVANISPKVLETQMELLVGKEAFSLYYTNYPNFISLMANLNYKTQLFPKLFEVDAKLQTRLEELILNQKRNVIIKEKRI